MKQTQQHFGRIIEMRRPMDQATQRKFRFRGIPRTVEEYLLCILLHFLLPFLPIATEAVVSGRVSSKTLLLFLAIYPLNIGISSQRKLLFAAAFVVSVIYSGFFGIACGALIVPAVAYLFGFSVVAGLALVHLMERYNRHIADSELFLKFV
jgi:hypothetical protein